MNYYPNTVSVLPFNSSVKVQGNIVGWISAISLKGSDKDTVYVSYFVRWFDDRSIKEDWFSRQELEPVDEAAPLMIGFDQLWPNHKSGSFPTDAILK